MGQFTWNASSISLLGINNSWIRRTLGHEGDDRAGQLLAVRFLDKVARAFDGRVRLVFATRDFSLKQLFRAAGDRIAVPESGQKWLLPLAQHLPSLLVRIRGRVIRRDGNELRHHQWAGLETFVWER